MGQQPLRQPVKGRDEHQIEEQFQPADRLLTGLTIFSGGDLFARCVGLTATEFPGLGGHRGTSCTWRK